MRTFLTIVILFSTIWCLNAKSLNISKTNNSPTIDGVITPEDGWSDTWQNINLGASGNTTNDMTAKFQMKYDSIFLYVLVRVYDSYKDTVSSNLWDKDCVIMYFAMDTNSNPSGTYKTGDYQFLNVRGSNYVLDLWHGSPWSSNYVIGVAEASDSSSYTQEWKIPWGGLAAVAPMEMPSVWNGKNFKFDIQATDRTSLGCTQLLFWNSGSNKQYQDTRYFGLVTLDSPISTPHPTPCTTSFNFYKVPNIYGLDSSSNPSDTLKRYQVTVKFVINNSTNISSVLWNFGDETTSTDLSPIHNYKNNSWNYVRLTAYKKDGSSCISESYMDLYDPNVCSAYFESLLYDSLNSSYKSYHFYDKSKGNIVAWEWNFGDSTYSTEKNPNHTYRDIYGAIPVSLKITTASGFEDTFHSYVYIQYPPADEICQVSVDKKTGKNLIKWCPTPGISIDKYYIQKESVVSNVFTTLDTVPFNEAGSYIDNTSNPQKHADRYKIVSVSKKGYVFGESRIHQTIHLAISQGNPSYYNLTWTPYFGFNFGTYYIYRGRTPDKLLLIDSISSNQTQCTDKYTGKAYYKVGIRNNYHCKSDSIIQMKTLVFGSVIQDGFILSNMDGMEYTNINEISSSFNIGPNPYYNQFTISADVNNSNVSIEIYNTLGEKIYSYNTKATVNGYFEHIINSADLRGATKVCIVKFTAGDKTGISKLIKK
jgi:hypothetical protein